MDDSKIVVSQVQELQLILYDICRTLAQSVGTLPESGDSMSGFLFCFIRESQPNIMVTKKPN